MPPGVGRNDRDICAERAFTIIKTEPVIHRLCFGFVFGLIPSLVRISCGMAFLFTITDRVLYSTNGREK